MGKPPAFQLYASDFYMDTAGWTVAQVGAYTRLLMYEWVNGPMPSDMASLSRIAGISDARTMYKMWSGTIGKKFISNNGNLLYNKRLEEEREKQFKYREKQAEKGLSGAKIRWKDHIATAIAQAIPDDSSSSSSSSYNKEKEKEINKEKEKEKESFELFWKEYPKKQGKGLCLKIWQKLNPSKELLEKILKTISIFKESEQWKKEKGKFIPMPSTWLNQGRWDDELGEQKSKWD